MNDLFPLICPHCKGTLTSDGKSLHCSAGHCYDLSKSGYVSLAAQVGTSGDDKAMVRARSEFLDSGAYKPLADTLCRLCGGSTEPIIDAGCGEGYYTNLLAGAHPESRVIGFDLSKAACDKAAKRARQLGASAFFAVASLFSLPIADESCGIVVNLFAPVAEDEFARILKPGGRLIVVGAGRRHLYELKAAVYDEVYENEGRRDLPREHFEQIEQKNLAYRFTAVGDNIRSLFSMTPYAFKTSPADRAKLDSLEKLEIGADFDIFIYKRK